MSQNQSRRRVVVNTQPASTHKYRNEPREAVVALALIVAAALATFTALLITSRPYDPMNSTIAPQESVPPAPIAIQASPKPSPSITPSPAERQKQAEGSPAPGGETGPPDDTEIKAAIERAFASDATLSNADVSALIENGRVTLVGSVESAEVKQRAEKAVRSIKGVTAINNQLLVTQATPQ